MKGASDTRGPELLIRRERSSEGGGDHSLTREGSPPHQRTSSKSNGSPGARGDSSSLWQPIGQQTASPTGKSDTEEDTSKDAGENHNVKLAGDSTEGSHARQCAGDFLLTGDVNSIDNISLMSGEMSAFGDLIEDEDSRRSKHNCEVAPSHAHGKNEATSGPGPTEQVFPTGESAQVRVSVDCDGGQPSGTNPSGNFDMAAMTHKVTNVAMLFAKLNATFYEVLARSQFGCTVPEIQILSRVCGECEPIIQGGLAELSILAEAELRGDSKGSSGGLAKDCSSFLNAVTNEVTEGTECGLNKSDDISMERMDYKEVGRKHSIEDGNPIDVDVKKMKISLPVAETRENSNVATVDAATTKKQSARDRNATIHKRCLEHWMQTYFEEILPGLEMSYSLSKVTVGNEDLDAMIEMIGATRNFQGLHLDDHTKEKQLNLAEHLRRFSREQHEISIPGLLLMMGGAMQIVPRYCEICVASATEEAKQKLASAMDEIKKDVEQKLVATTKEYKGIDAEERKAKVKKAKNEAKKETAARSKSVKCEAEKEMREIVAKAKQEAKLDWKNWTNNEHVCPFCKDCYDESKIFVRREECCTHQEGDDAEKGEMAKSIEGV